MKRAFIAAVPALVSILPLLLSCSDKRADAGLTGPDRVTTITKSGPASLEPLFFSEVTIDQSDRAVVSMQTAKGHLPNRSVLAPRGSFESIAEDLADFRRVKDGARSDCRGITDAGQVTVSWHYASGSVGSYSVQPGCARRDEQRFLETARSIARRVGLQSWIDRAPNPQ